MSRALQRLAIDVAVRRSACLDEAGDVAGARLQRETGRWAIEQAALAQGRLQARVEMGKRAGQPGDDLSLAANARIENLRLRHIHCGVEIDLVACGRAVEPGGSVLADRQEIGEAEPAAGQRPRAAGQS